MSTTLAMFAALLTVVPGSQEPDPGLAGTWEGIMSEEGDTVHVRLVLKEDEERISGTYTWSVDEDAVAGTVAGTYRHPDVTLSLAFVEYSIRYQATRIGDDRIEALVIFPDSDEDERFRLVLYRTGGSFSFQGGMAPSGLASTTPAQTGPVEEAAAFLNAMAACVSENSEAIAESLPRLDWEELWAGCGLDPSLGSLSESARVLVQDALESSMWAMLEVMDDDTIPGEDVVASFLEALSKAAEEAVAVFDATVACASENSQTLAVGDSVGGVLAAGDEDCFRIDMATAGRLEVSTSGANDTYGELYDSARSLLEEDDDGGADYNFLISRDVPAGTYYIEVAGFSDTDTGPYLLRATSPERTTPVAVGDFPPEDVPGLPELRDCSVESFDYYYGVVPDYEKARCAAFREFDDGRNGPFSGAGVLMMLYANGYGVEQNLDLAIRLSSEVLRDSDYESDLRRMRATPGAGEFDVCDFFTGGLYYGMCDSFRRSSDEAKVEAEEWTLRMQRLIDEDEPLRQLMDEFTATRLGSEIETSGSAARYENLNLEERFMNVFHAVSLELFAAGRFPTYTEDEFREADRELNRIYSELRSREDYPFGDRPEELQFENVRNTQRLWLRYRDAWVEFGRRRYPQVSSWSWLGWLTTWRNRQLEEIGGTPGYESFVDWPEDSDVRRRVEETLVPGSSTEPDAELAGTWAGERRQFTDTGGP